MVLKESDLDAYYHEITTEVAVLALRSAFRLGRPDDRRRSHYLRLGFVWDPKPKNIRHRFLLVTADVEPYQDEQGVDRHWAYIAPERLADDAFVEDAEKREDSALCTILIVAAHAKLGGATHTVGE